MEFFCVLSVGGSLASYQVQQESEKRYRAVLRNTNGKRDDISAAIVLTKEDEAWQASPPHDEIVPSLIHAIENNHR